MATENNLNSRYLGSALCMDELPERYTYFWDNLEVGKWYSSACYICGVAFCFKFSFPIGNVQLMLVKTAPSGLGHICAPVCSEECRLTFRGLIVMAQ